MAASTRPVLIMVASAWLKQHLAADLLGNLLDVIREQSRVSCRTLSITLWLGCQGLFVNCILFGAICMHKLPMANALDGLLLLVKPGISSGHSLVRLPIRLVVGRYHDT